MSEIQNGHVSSTGRFTSAYSEVQKSRLDHSLPLPSVLRQPFKVVQGPPSSAAGNPASFCGRRILIMTAQQEEKYEIVHIPNKLPISPTQQPTVDVIASLIEPKHANAVVRKLNQLAPLENLRHIKRVHKKRLGEGKVQLSVILCLACEDGNTPASIVELINAYKLSTFLTKVCRYAATTKKEWEEQCKLWPTSYHPLTYNIDGITGFCEEDRQSIARFMKLAVDMAKYGVDHVVNAAIIVDPSVKLVIASASDETCSCSGTTDKTMERTCLVQPEECFPFVGNKAESHVLDPVRQAMKPSTTFYKSQNMHLHGSSDELKQLYTAVSCLYPWQWAKQQSHSSSCSWHPLRHAAIVAIESSSARDKSLYPGSGHIVDDSIDMDHIESSPLDPLAKRQKTTFPNDDIEIEVEANCVKSERPYLCTGYDIYLVWEPCIMCAMALVHQRIRRIFYAFPNSNAGALGSVQRLQGEKSLNHHYAVFRVLLPENVLHR